MTDLLGLTPGKAPRFVRRFAEAGEAARAALADYHAAVGARAFPAARESY